MNQSSKQGSSALAVQGAGQAAPTIGDYYSATQLRADRWSALRGLAEELALHGAEGRKGRKLLAEAEALFEALTPIEVFWAFPGASAFAAMQRLLEQRKIPDVTQAVRRAARALISGAYRRRAVPLLAEEGEAEEFEDEGALSPDARALGRPYFEVLIVDDLTEQQERWLRTSLQRARRPEDPFTYEPVVVPSLEDALIGILLNYNVQALIRPGDIVLVDRDCHKSHHYGLVLAGADVVYMDSYPLHEHSMYGAVPTREIKHKLLELRASGDLDRVRMILLTNCTFDGLIYNVERVMEECLAIKKDLVFLWDEAWFAFARFNPVYRQRTAMATAARLRASLRDPARAQAWAEQEAALADADDEAWLERRLIAPPDMRVRVYATQSTHKTLTSLRQGSMIHVHDQDFKGATEQAFHEAYMTHTSTSPNYQIIASLDVGRRQVELEGYEFVQRQIDCALSLRRAVASHPLLGRYFKVLTVADMIPARYRESGAQAFYDTESGWADDWDYWAEDEFVLDPCKVTLAVGGTGWDGDTFKTRILMDRHGIQINKTSRNSVLFMTNIGTTRSSVAYLIKVLISIARDLDDLLDDASRMERHSFERRVASLVEHVPPLPDFSRFHPAFCDGRTVAGDIRKAFFLAYDEENCDYLDLAGDVGARFAEGGDLVAASFIIPYPPGFPILVPGQVISREILDFMRALDVSEIHGYRPDLGLRIFTAEALTRAAGQG